MAASLVQITSSSFYRYRESRSLENDCRVGCLDYFLKVRISKSYLIVFGCLLLLCAFSPIRAASTLYSVECAQTKLGAIPDAWRDVIDDRANPSWGVDGQGFLRTLLKNYEGLIVYEGVL